MMAEQNVLMRGIKVGPVVQPLRRRDPPIVQLDDAPCEEPAIEPIGQHVEAGCGDHEPEPVDLLLWMENAGDDSEADRTERGDRGPEDRGESRHETMLARSTESCKGSATRNAAVERIPLSLREGVKVRGMQGELKRIDALDCCV